MRVSYPEVSILLALADIKACFRFPSIHPALTGAVGFLISNLFCLVVAIIFLVQTHLLIAGNLSAELLRA